MMSSEIQIDAQDPNAAEMADPGTPYRKSSVLTDRGAATNSSHNAGVQQELQEVMKELEALRERREALEARRRKLLAESIPPRRRGTQALSSSRSNTNSDAPDCSTETASLQLLNYRCSTISSTRRHRSHSVLSAPDRSGAVAAHNSSLHGAKIPSESERRRSQADNPYAVSKKAIRSAASKDSMCMMGDFLLEDNERVCTFGRERRFMPLVGQRGAYHLGAAVETSQLESRRRSHSRRPEPQSTSGLLDGTPGPGAYTPRFNKVSKPSPLVYR